EGPPLASRVSPVRPGDPGGAHPGRCPGRAVRVDCVAAEADRLRRQPRAGRAADPRREGGVMMPPVEDPLLAYRDRFPILGRTNYLISNSLGAVPEAARDSLVEYYEAWADRGVRAWEETWWEMTGRLGDLVAPLIGAGPGEVVFQPNVTVSHAVVF